MTGKDTALIFDVMGVAQLQRIKPFMIKMPIINHKVYSKTLLSSQLIVARGASHVRHTILLFIIQKIRHAITDTCMYCYLIFATEVFQALPIQDPKSQSSQQPSTEYSYF